jgi:protein-S-isoprenylcysteine O-methyltransferase Ste14
MTLAWNTAATPAMRGAIATGNTAMIIRPRVLFALFWIAWLVSWIVAAFWANRTEKRAFSWDTLFYQVIVLSGAALLTPWAARRLHMQPLWHVGLFGAYLLAALTFVGLAFTWWARLHLGRLWSGSITRKEGHRVVDTGPYALVRHPIYSGLIFALFATAIAQARIGGLAGAALIAFGLWVKARIEERFLTAELGADAYGAYRSRVPMLVPFLGTEHR